MKKGTILGSLVGVVNCSALFASMVAKAREAIP
jgi:hypothetical protein